LCASATTELGKTTFQQSHKNPLIWVFMGLPGDTEHEAQYTLTTERIIRALQAGFDIQKDDITVLFGSGIQKRYPACNADNLTRELERICVQSRSPRPIWIFFLGHSSSTRIGVNFNLAGRDLSSRDIAKHLNGVRDKCDMVIFLTTAAAGKYVKDLSMPGRVLVCATDPTAEDNETEFPHAMAEVLEDPNSNLDGDGYLSVLEIFRETKRKVEVIYKRDKLVQDERPLLDGNGDGRGTGRPSERDALPAGHMKLKLKKRSLNQKNDE